VECEKVEDLEKRQQQAIHDKDAALVQVSNVNFKKSRRLLLFCLFIM